MSKFKENSHSLNRGNIGDEKLRKGVHNCLQFGKHWQKEKGLGFEARFKSHFYYFLTVWPWTGYLTTLRLSFSSAK